MPQLGLIGEREQAPVQYLSLSLKVEGGAGHLWQAQTERGFRKAEGSTIIKALHELFWILGSWKPQGQLKLEIEVYSHDRITDDLGIYGTDEGELEHVILGKETNMFVYDTYEN
ncbi:hypothetical protein F5Y18DRAFT_380535 [Xylariaceae sp. FL1019]|nr:hypothetical protein F5Y18DRAFT_380535 [Xylariaceae sp. FL1019]